MDAQQFDQVAKALGRGNSRRRLLAGLLGATLAAPLGRAGAQACKANGKACKKNSQCCSNNCVGASGGSVNDGTCQDECFGVADGTPCGGTGSGLRCCNGVCPPPCRPTNMCCDPNTTCADCCGGAQLDGENPCSETGGISCAPVPPGSDCKSDVGCGGINPRCVCGTCFNAVT